MIKTKDMSPVGLKYAFLLHSSSLGGAELSTLELIQGLVARGNTIECILPTGGKVLPEKLRIAGAKVHLVPGLTWWTSDPVIAIQESAGIESVLKSFECDLVVTITGVVPQAALAARNLGIPHVWCLHEFLDIDHGLKIPFSLDSFPKIMYDFSDKIVCNSKSVRDHFFPAPDKKIDVVYPYPRDLEETIKQNRSPRGLGSRFKLGLIANFSPGKGHILLLNALQEVNKSKLIADVSFFGDGGTQELRAEIQAFIVKNSMEEIVEFRGFVESKKEMFASVDAIVVPSLNEGFGRVPFEAMAFSKPIIYSDSGALAEYMIPNKTGISFQANDSSALAAAILKMVDPKANIQDFIESGHEFIIERAKFESYVLDFMRICKEAVFAYSEVSLKNDLSKLIKDYSVVTHQRDELTHQRDELLNSTIWKISKPLRSIINYFKKFLP